MYGRLGHPATAQVQPEAVQRQPATRGQGNCRPHHMRKGEGLQAAQADVQRGGNLRYPWAGLTVCVETWTLVVSNDLGANPLTRRPYLPLENARY